MTTEHKPHSELSAAIQVLQDAYDHGHPDDLAKCPWAFEVLAGLVEQLETLQAFFDERINLWHCTMEDHRRMVEYVKGLQEQLETLQRRNRVALEHANKGAAWSSSEEPTKEDAARFHGALIFVIANLNGTLDTSNPASEPS